MVPRSSLYETANSRLRGQLPERIVALRTEGHSWEAIAQELHTEAGIRVTGDTVQSWAKALEAEADKAAS